MPNFYAPKKQVKKMRKQQSVTIEKLDLACKGLAYVDNKVVFVAGALPQEQVDIQIIDEHKTWASAQLLDITKASDKRITPACSHFELCGGCQTQYISGEDQLTYKEQALKQRLGEDTTTLTWEPAITSQPWHYRRRGRIAVKVEKNNKLRVGFRKTASSDIVKIKQCNVLAKPFSDLFEPLAQLIDSLTARDKVGHVEVIATEQQNTLLFRCLANLSVQDKQKLNIFSAAHNMDILLEMDNKKVISLDDALAEPLSYQLNDVALEFSPGDFIQVNQQVNEKMVARAIEWLALDSDNTVLDLFCGIGNFSFEIAKRAKLVVGVEGVREMAEQAQRNASNANIDNVTFFHCNLAQPLTEQQWFSGKLRKKVDRILLDPARDGALDICKQLSQLQPQRIVYVSCEPASLERDSKVIIEQGYQLQKICAMDMFPNTKHVESMALFVKVKTKPKRIKKRLG